MKLSFIKFRIVLFIAVFLVFVSVFSNRIVLAKTNPGMGFDDSAVDLPADFVWTTNLSGDAKLVFQKINDRRKLKRLNSLIWDKEAADLAYNYSKKMAKEDFFSHFDSDGNSIVERAEEHKLKNWTKIGENLFQCEGYENPVDIAVKGWLKSKTHRQNVYDPDWTHTGIGFYKTRQGEVFITQVFLQKNKKTDD